MTPLTFAIIGLRLMGIYLVVESGPLFATGFLYLTWTSPEIPNSTTQFAALFSCLVPGGLQVLTGILLFAFSAPLARRIIPAASGETENASYSYEEAGAIAFATAGLLILATALPVAGRAGQSLYYWYSYQEQGGNTFPNQLRESWMWAVGVFAQIIIGFALLLNPRGFRNIWHWLRTAGTRSNA